MKKLIILFFVFTFINIFSQEYHFDCFVIEKSIRIKPDKSEWIANFLYNSSDGTVLFIKTEKDKIIGTFYEKINDRRHVFRIKKNGNNLLFDYKYSNQFNNQKPRITHNKEDVIKVQKIDSLKFNIDVFKNSKLKKKVISAIVTVEKSDFDYLKFNADYNKTDEINEKLKSLLGSNYNYIIKTQQIKYHSSGYVFDKNVQKIQKIALAIKLPEKLIFKEFNYGSDFED